LRLALSNGPNRVDVPIFSTVDGNRPSFRKAVLCGIYNSGRWTKSKNPATQNLHCIIPIIPECLMVTMAPFPAVDLDFSSLLNLLQVLYNLPAHCANSKQQNSFPAPQVTALTLFSAARMVRSQACFLLRCKFRPKISNALIYHYNSPLEFILKVSSMKPLLQLHADMQTSLNTLLLLKTEV
jgi:hypothetical protein